MAVDKVIQSCYPGLTLPEMSTWHFLFDQADGPKEDQVVYVDCDTEKQLKFGEVRELTKRLGFGFANKKNLHKGDVVVCFTTLTLMTPVVVLATQAASLCVAFAPHNSSLNQLMYIINNSQPKLLLVGEATLGLAKQAASQCGYPRDRIHMIERDDCGEFKSIWDIAGGEGEELEPMRLSTDEVKTLTTFMCYSSGTTGVAKGIEITHFNLTSGFTQINNGRENTRANTAERWLCTKIEHLSGIMQCFRAVYGGGTLYCCTKDSPQAWLGAIQKHCITSVFLMAYLAIWFAKDPVIDQYDLSSLQTIILGGGVISDDIVKRIEKRNGATILMAYGMTETTCGVSIPSSQSNQKRGSVGKLMPNMSAKLVGGELLVKGPNITKGYLNNPKKTAELFTADGWMKTGDLCEFDEEGYLFVIGRREDLIYFKELRIVPEAIEAVLNQHSGVEDCAVVPFFDQSLASDVPKALVVLSSTAQGNQNIEEDIVKWVDERVPDYQRLRGGVSVLEAIPRGRTGKVLRTLLRGKYQVNESVWLAPSP